MMEKVHPEFIHSDMTMTVGELISVLQNFAPEIPVLATWEGVDAGIRKGNFFTRISDTGRFELVIDVETYG